MLQCTIRLVKEVLMFRKHLGREKKKEKEEDEEEEEEEE